LLHALLHGAKVGSSAQSCDRIRKLTCSDRVTLHALMPHLICYANLSSSLFYPREFSGAIAIRPPCSRFSVRRQTRNAARRPALKATL
jgi:hypothetical protein